MLKSVNFLVSVGSICLYSHALRRVVSWVLNRDVNEPILNKLGTSSLSLTKYLDMLYESLKYRACSKVLAWAQALSLIESRIRVKLGFSTFNCSQDDDILTWLTVIGASQSFGHQHFFL